jgi:hypothetical protein
VNSSSESAAAFWGDFTAGIVSGFGKTVVRTRSNCRSLTMQQQNLGVKSRSTEFRAHREPAALRAASYAARLTWMIGRRVLSDWNSMTNSSGAPDVLIQRFF